MYKHVKSSEKIKNQHLGIGFELLVLTVYVAQRREAGAIPPWVIPEEHKRSFIKNEIHPIPLNADHEVKEINSSDHTISEGSAISTILKPKKEQLYITGGQLVNSDHIQFANILIEDGKIVSTGTNIEVQPDTPTLDATGMLIMPAGIDMSTYLIQDIHSIDTEAYVSYTKEALLGGTTTIVDTIVCPKGSSAIDLVIKYRNTFKEVKFWCDIIIRIGFIEGIQENQINEIEQLTKQYGINSFLLELRSIEKCIFLATSINCPIIFTSINGMNIIEKISEAKRQIPPIHITVCCTSNSLLSEIPHNQVS
ncbi:dihydropyrimidinase related protein-3 (M38 family) [Schistosoma mansoni]|uniref:dihydropyrimidinase related protein-3 (M38 family) n=1 Tax=Schistosoma mansoni TaxID=6183 RepID=UPI00022DC74F|nr:dihydropyrimidinase related protein-3 (M38 family) [Schistosoma mansoni]|eukprot:XP_018649512.1 dihydropyrimidinase related protein-3 (M38 family) [Schistosoma mansoni]